MNYALTFSAEKISFRWKLNTFRTKVLKIRSFLVSLKPNSRSCALKSKYDSIDVTPNRNSFSAKFAISMPDNLKWRGETCQNRKHGKKSVKVCVSLFVRMTPRKFTHSLMIPPDGIESSENFAMELLSISDGITEPSVKGAKPCRNLNPPRS